MLTTHMGQQHDDRARARCMTRRAHGGANGAEEGSARSDAVSSDFNLPHTHTHLYCTGICIWCDEIYDLGAIGRQTHDMRLRPGDGDTHAQSTCELVCVCVPHNLRTLLVRAYTLYIQ